MKARVLVVTQGGLGRAVVQSAAAVVGCEPSAEVIELPWSTTAAEAEELLTRRLAADGGDGRKGGDEVLILTDLYGSTPDRAARRLAGSTIAVVSGLNLAMLVCLGCSKPEGETAADLAAWVRGKAIRSITCGAATDGERDRAEAECS